VSLVVVTENVMHIFVCPQYEPLKGAYPRVLNSRAYRLFHSAHAIKSSDFNPLFRTFPTQGGPVFWSQLAEFLIACCNARTAFLDEYRTLRAGLDDYSRMGRISLPVPEVSACIFWVEDTGT
jgi:hypothetical protein